jgi:hypothetical protein
MHQDVEGDEERRTYLLAAPEPANVGVAMARARAEQHRVASIPLYGSCCGGAIALGVKQHTAYCTTMQSDAAKLEDAYPQYRQQDTEPNIIWARRIANPDWELHPGMWMAGVTANIVRLAKDFMNILRVFELDVDTVEEVVLNPVTAQALLLQDGDDTMLAHMLFGFKLSVSPLVPGWRVLLYDGALYYGERQLQS